VAHIGRAAETVTPCLVSKARAAACWFSELPTEGTGYTQIKCSDLGIATDPENSI